jgi:hypothetical protein
MANFYARFIPRFSERAAPLYALKRKGDRFVWGDEQQASFESLKRALSEAPVLQIPDFEKEFVLVTDVSDAAVSAVLNQRVNGVLAPISFHSKLLSPCERRRYSTYEKECLAALFGCEKCGEYLEHKEFELQCDNLALCWLLRNVKDVGRLGRWILRLALYKFRVVHTKGLDDVVADALSRMFDSTAAGKSEAGYVALLQDLPLVYCSLEDQKKQDPFCMDLCERLSKDLAAESKLELHRGLLCYRHRGVAKRRYWIPSTLRAMLLKYFHDSPLSGHLGAFKILNRISSNFYWPNMRQEIFQYVRRCDLCQRARSNYTSGVTFCNTSSSSVGNSLC